MPFLRMAQADWEFLQALGRSQIRTNRLPRKSLPKGGPEARAAFFRYAEASLGGWDVLASVVDVIDDIADAAGPLGAMHIIQTTEWMHHTPPTDAELHDLPLPFL